MPAEFAGAFGQANTGNVFASTLMSLATIRVTICDLLTTPAGPYSVNGVEESCRLILKRAAKAAPRPTCLNKARTARQTDYYAKR